MTLTLARLAPPDVQATLLVCKAWSAGFSHGLVSLRPRLLAVPRLAARFPALARLDLGACAGSVRDGDVDALVGGLPRLASLSLAGAEGVTDAGVGALPGLAGLTSLSLYNCSRVRYCDGQVGGGGRETE